MVQEQTVFAPIALAPIPDGADPLTTTEAQALQDQVDTLTTALTQTQAALTNTEAALANAQANQTAFIDQFITQGQRLNELEAQVAAADARPAEGDEIETGEVDEGRSVWLRGVGVSMGTPAGGQGQVVIGSDVWKLTATDVIVHLLGPGGVSYQTPLPWIDYDSQVRWITIEVDAVSGDMAFVANMPTGWTIQSYWGVVEYTKR